MADKVERQRAALKRFFDSYGKRSRNRVCSKAKVAESAVRAFMNGTTQYLEERTYEKLSGYSGWSIASLKGDEPSPDSTKTPSVLNHSSKEIGQTHSYRTDDGSVGGQEMSDRLLIEMLDKILDLPPGHRQRLKRHIEAIEGAESRPTSRVRTKP